MSSSRPVASGRARPIIEGPTYMAPRYHSRAAGRIIFLLLVLVLAGLGGGGGAVWWALHRAQSTSSRTVAFQVTSGDTVSSIASRLHKKGLIDNTLLFRLDARFQGLAAKLKAGNYSVRRNMSIDDMVAAFAVYKQTDIAITIPEGKRMEQIAAILQAHGINGQQFLREARHPTIKDSILADKPGWAPLEGYLLPETYDVPRGYSGKAFADDMVRLLGQRFTPAMRATVRRQGRTIYGVLKLASIVEREARLPSERSLIAGVYTNRLRSPDRIMDADPTVQYSIGSARNWWPVLQDQAHNINPRSPYNTYTHAGLPPTPICNPGMASITAAVYPRPTKYMYFVAVKNGHGRHVFAVTLQQQNQNIAQYG